MGSLVSGLGLGKGIKETIFLQRNENYQVLSRISIQQEIKEHNLLLQLRTDYSKGHNMGDGRT